MDYYEYDENSQELGAGGSAVVFKAAERATHIMRAIKRVTKKEVKDVEYLQNEIQIMKLLDPPNIPRLYETFEDDKHLYLVMELCEGGDLLDKLLETTYMYEPQAGIVMR